MANRNVLLAMAGLPLLAVAAAMGAQDPVEETHAEAVGDEEVGDEAANPKVDSRMLRASDELQILFEGRIALMFDEVNKSFPLEAEAIREFKDQTEEAVVQFFADHELKYGREDPWGRYPKPVLYEPFDSFLGSDVWSQVFQANLSEEAQSLWLERREERKSSVVTSLAHLLRAEVTRSYCIPEEEHADLDPFTTVAAQAQLEIGLIGETNSIIFNNKMPDPMFDRVSDARIEEGLSPARAELHRSIKQEGRSSYHDYCFEVEALLPGGADDERLRSLLYGCADAIAYRDGGTPQQLNYRLATSGKTERDSYWERTLTGLLDLDEDFDFETLPSRSKAGVYAARTEFFLAVIDERAILSKDLKDSLRPLLKEFVVEEYSRESVYRPVKPQFPDSFGVAEDGTLGAKGDAAQSLSTKQKSKVTALRDACSQQQRDVLDD